MNPPREYPAAPNNAMSTPVSRCFVEDGDMVLVLADGSQIQVFSLHMSLASSLFRDVLIPYMNMQTSINFGWPRTLCLNDPDDDPKAITTLCGYIYGESLASTPTLQELENIAILVEKYHMVDLMKDTSTSWLGEHLTHVLDQTINLDNATFMLRLLVAAKNFSNAHLFRKISYIMMVEFTGSFLTLGTVNRIEDPLIFKALFCMTEQRDAAMAKLRSPNTWCIPEHIISSFTNHNCENQPSATVTQSPNSSFDTNSIIQIKPETKDPTVCQSQISCVDRNRLLQTEHQNRALWDSGSISLRKLLLHNRSSHRQSMPAIVRRNYEMSGCESCRRRFPYNKLRLENDRVFQQMHWLLMGVCLECLRFGRDMGTCRDVHVSEDGESAWRSLPDLEQGMEEQGFHSTVGFPL